MNLTPAQWAALTFCEVSGPEWVVGRCALLVVEVMMLLKVLWDAAHVGPALLAILLCSAIWDVGPHYPRACARGFVDGGPIFGVSERLVEAEVWRWRAIEM